MGRTSTYITVLSTVVTVVHRISQWNGHPLEPHRTTRYLLLLVPLTEALKAGRVHKACWRNAIAKHAKEVVDVLQRRFNRFKRERFPVLTHDSHLERVCSRLVIQRKVCTRRTVPM